MDEFQAYDSKYGTFGHFVQTFLRACNARSYRRIKSAIFDFRDRISSTTMARAIVDGAASNFE